MKSLEQLFNKMNAKTGFEKLNRWNKWDSYLGLSVYLTFAYLVKAFLYEFFYMEYHQSLFATLLTLLIIFFAIEKLIKFRYQVIFCIIPGYAKIRREAIDIMKNWQKLLSEKDNQLVLARALDAYVKKNPSISANRRFKELLQGMEKGFGNGEKMQLNLCWFHERMGATTLAEFEEYLSEQKPESIENKEIEKEVGKYEF